MILYLIRHGETDWNREKRVMGRKPVPLNRNGREGIAMVARFLADRGIEMIFSGTLARTVESAGILAAEWKVPVVSEPGLDESAFQRWVGKSYSELRPDHDFKLYMSRPTESRFSDREGMEDIQKRIIEAAKRICGDPDIRRAAAVSHSDVIKPALAHWLGMELDMMHRLTISNASVTRVDLNPGAPPKLRYINLVPRQEWS